jgi:hypothetical protein
VRLAEKRQHVVFAQAKELYVFYDNHFIVRNTERCAVQDVIHILVIAAGKELERLLKALRRLAQSLAAGVFSDQPDNFPHVAGDALIVIRRLSVKKYFFALAIARLGHVRAPGFSAPLALS